ncbi:MAG: right-handed parallel beta-helix repeat-containing protein, partial [Ruminococcaceae bacterium]|nr:right-handed parallel beta-helix repeat-containing protein [Oscillospiraceae bacterium]
PDFDKPYITEEKHTEAGNNLDVNAFPYVERAVDGSYTAITAENFVKGIADGTLAKGGYLISDGTLKFDSRFNNKITDLSGYFVKAHNIEFAGVESARIKNLTAELTNGGTLIKTDSVRDCRIMGWQVSYSGESEAELLNTVGTATNAQKADLVIDALRFVGNGKVKGITFTDSVKYATLINSYITGVKDYAVKDSGISTEGVYTANNYIEGNIILNKDSAVVKYNTVKGNVTLGGNFAMTASSNISGNITVADKQSVSILKNTVAGNITLTNGKSCAVIENNATQIIVTGGKNCIVENNNNAGRGNNGKPVTSVTVDKNGTDHYGSNVYDQSERKSVGVNKDLLAKADNKIFVGIERKLYLNDNGNIKAVGQFVEDNAKLEDDVFLAPGAYTLNSARLYNKTGLDLYFYCSLFEATTSRMSYWNFTLNNSKNCSLRGITIGYNEAALGQGKVTQVEDDYFIVEAMPGYYPDLSINEYYIKNFYTLIYRDGSSTPAEKANFTGDREYLGDGFTKFYNTSNSDQTSSQVYSNIQVGDTFAARVRGNRFIQYDNNTNCLTEDLTAYSSVEAAIGDQWGNKNYYNRLLSLPGYGYEVDSANEKFSYWQEKGWITEYNGKYYGPEAIWGVSNFLNANENAVGPQVTNYKANQRHDDAFNIHGVYSSVTDYNYFTKTITYDNSASAYGNVTRHFKAGDKILVYLPSSGRILGETTAAADTVSYNGGEYFTLKLTNELLYYFPGAIMFNLSALGDGFLYDNCELRMSYPRGGVIKASGTMQYCSISESGRAGILVSPEVVDSSFCESGYVNGLNLLYNEIKNTNLTEELTDDNSALAIIGSSKKLDSGYIKHQNIVIKGNRFENWGAHAIYIDSADNVKILDNIFIDNKAYSDSRSPIYISGAKNVEVSGNMFPAEFKYNQRAEYSASDTENIYGTDLSEKLYDASNLTALRKMLLNIAQKDNSYDFYKDGEINVRDLVRLKKIIANQ